MPKPFKRRGALLKLLGTSVLFVSFITQNFFYESWHQSAESLYTAQSARSLIDKGALINEGHFYILSSHDLASAIPDQRALAEYKIRQFVLKLYQSEVINISSLGQITPELKTKYIEALRTRATAVKDYQSAAGFTEFLNRQAESYQSAFSDERAALSQKRTIAKWAYLLLYATGALLLLVGLHYDWKGVEE
jgi:hypothetical protein